MPRLYSNTVPQCLICGIDMDKKELKCPECGHVFQVSQEVFDSLAAQVRNAVMTEELDRRAAELEKRLTAQHEVAEIEKRREFDAELETRARQIASRDAEIALLKERLANAPRDVRQQLERELSDRDREISRMEQELKSARDTFEVEKRVAILEMRERQTAELRRRDEEITRLQGCVEAGRKDAELRMADLNAAHAVELAKKDETIRYYKDFKTSLSTKMLGETLEIHCRTEFERHQAMGMFPDAQFWKDNDTSPGGTKGDFIFRDYVGGEEYISIMFEMKNEADETATRHRNEDFLAKLHKDRTEKGCEYAVLVTMLEKQSDLYNQGIVNMSHRYPKMYVIRPQFFMTLIVLLSQASRKSIGEIHALRAELEIARAQTVDVTNFERRRDEFVRTFSSLVEAHSKKHLEAMADIDKVIESLERQVDKLRKVKSAFETSHQKLLKANESAETKFTIKRLCHGNPTMRRKFDEARDSHDNLRDENE